MSKKNIRLIAAVVNCKCEILLEKSPDGYRLPCGRILKGEMIEDAYKRFVKNDIWLDIELLCCVKAFNFDEIDTVSIVFVCTPLKKYMSERTLPSQYEWYTYENTKKLVVRFPWREVIETSMHNFK